MEICDLPVLSNKRMYFISWSWGDTGNYLEIINILLNAIWYCLTLLPLRSSLYANIYIDRLANVRRSERQKKIASSTVA